MADELTKPEGLTDEELVKVQDYLDELRESGETNMFGAGPYLKAKYGFAPRYNRKVLQYWMENFHNRHPKGE